MQVKKFKTAAEADAFEKKLMPVLIKMHPEVKKPPKYPDASHSYVGNAPSSDDDWGEDRRFSMERQQGSMFNTFVLQKFPGSVKLVTFDKKNKAGGVLLSTQNPGGFILADEKQGTIVIAVPDDETGHSAKVKKLLPGLGEAKAWTKAKAKPAGKLTLDGRVIVYDSSLSRSQLAKLNWKNAPFVEGAMMAFEKSGSGPLQVPNMKEAGGAFISVPSGQYTVHVRDDVEVGGSSLQVFWLVHD
jgi:hypothetical protein